MDLKKFRPLIRAAIQAQKKAFCPYSNFPVGAAVLTDTGRIVSGCNVENGCFNLGACAERVAVWNAVSQGAKSLKAICVVCRIAKPCGACRQVMFEFSTPETVLIMVDREGGKESIRWTWMRSTLPDAFEARGRL